MSPSLRLIAGGLGVVLMVGCGSSAAPSPATTEAAADTKPTQVSSVTPGFSTPTSVPGTVGPSYPVGDPRGIPEDAFTVAADPLSLTPTLDHEHASTTDIGPDGGEISATDANGVLYTLTIPADDLPFMTTITLTPIASLTGFPNATPPTNVIGVDLSPNGLELGNPATLAIEANADLPNRDVVALEYRGEGSEVGFHYFDQLGPTATMSVEHFSGYAVASPFLIGDESPALLFKYFTQSEIEGRLRSEVSFLLAVQRQLQNAGVEVAWNTVDVARAALSLYKRLVITPRVGVADRSCTDAQAAIDAYLEYQRQRQLLGVAEDPEFDLVGAGLFVPDALVDIAVEVCFKEQYEFCVKFGDHRGLASYYLSFFQHVVYMGLEPKQEHLLLAQDYLRRCGRWRVKIATTDNMTTTSAPNNESFVEVTREFFVQWAPSNSPEGIAMSVIEGTGPLEATKLTSKYGTCTSVLSDVTSDRDAYANLTSLVFGYPEGPTQSGEPLPPVLVELKVVADLGLLGYTTSGCDTSGRGKHEFEFNYYLAILELGIPIDQVTIGEARFEKDWQIRTEPFKATLVQSSSATTPGQAGDLIIDTRNEVTIEHEPL